MIVLKLFLKLFMILLGIPVLAVLLLFVPKDRETLPRAFRWFDNHEAHLRNTDDIDGLMGPSYYRLDRNTSDKDNLSFWKIYWERFNWLALRNPINYFQYVHLGFFLKRPAHVLIKGDENVGDHSWSTFGTVERLLTNGDGKKYTEYYRVMPWPLTNEKYGYRIRIGYKIGSILDKKDGHPVQYVFSISPFKRVR